MNEQITEIKEVTLEDLLAKKLDLGDMELKEYFSDILGGNIKFKRINPSKVSDLIASMNKGESSEFDMYQMLVYESCDLFKNKELIEQYKVAEPFEVVYKVLKNSIAEIYDMGAVLLAWYGFDIDLKKQ